MGEWVASMNTAGRQCKRLRGAVCRDTGLLDTKPANAAEAQIYELA